MHQGSFKPKHTMELSEFLTYRMARVQAKLNAMGNRLVQERCGLTLAQWRILLLVSMNEGSTSSDLTRSSAMDKGLFSRKVKSMVDSGLVSSKQDEDDSRVYRLSLTDAGKLIMQDLLPYMQGKQVELINRLTEDELKHMRSALEKIERAIEEE